MKTDTAYGRESEYFTGDTSIDIHSLGPTIVKTSITKTRLYKYIVNFTAENMKILR